MFPQRRSHVHGSAAGLLCSSRQHGPSRRSVLPEPSPSRCACPRHHSHRHDTDSKLQRPLWHEHSTFLRHLAGSLLRESPAIGPPELSHAHTHTRPDQIVFVGNFLILCATISLLPSCGRTDSYSRQTVTFDTRKALGFEVINRLVSSHRCLSLCSVGTTGN